MTAHLVCRPERDLPVAVLRVSGVLDLITSNARDLRPETTAALESAGWRLTQEWEFTAVHVLKYERE